MTMISYHDSDLPRSQNRPTVLSQSRAALRSALTFIRSVDNAWQRRRNEKLLESLPSEIRKDIGWPVPTDTTPRQR